MVTGTVEQVTKHHVQVGGVTYALTADWKAVKGPFPFTDIPKDQVKIGKSVVLHGPPKTAEVHSVRLLG